MTSADVLSALRRRPFEPFRIEVSDGTGYEVRHPELVLVGVGSLTVGIPPANAAAPVYERVETVSLFHVVKLVPVPAVPAEGGNGYG